MCSSDLEIVTMLAMSDDAEEGFNSFLTDDVPGWKGRPDETDE